MTLPYISVIDSSLTLKSLTVTAWNSKCICLVFLGHGFLIFSGLVDEL